MIEVGMVITTIKGSPYTVTFIAKGQYGLYIEGVGHLGITDFGFLPYELPPGNEQEYDWYGWDRRSYIILPDGTRLGGLSFRNFGRKSLEECETKWERTEIAMRKEEGNGEVPRS